VVLRAMGQNTPDLPASNVVEPIEEHVLRRHVPADRLPAGATVRQVMLAVARLGGHQPSNGSPGWQILARGWERLMAEVAGWRAALSWARIDFA